VGEPRWCYDLARAIVERTPAVIIAQTPRRRDYTIADLFPECVVHEHRPWQLDALPGRIHALFKPNYIRFYQEARRVLKQVDPASIDCAHHFGPLALRFPTPLAGLTIPYVIGPLGGSLPTPPAFVGDRARQPWYYRLRDFDGLRFRHDPLLRASYQNAACVVGVAPYVQNLLAPMKTKGFETRPEIAAKPPVDDIEAVLARRSSVGGAVRMLIVSRLIFSKGVQYAVHAAARLPRDTAWHIDVLGDGPLREEIAKLIAEFGLGERITLHGHVTRTQVDEFYRESDLFLFPSFREPSGAVVFEAMSWGLPMIAADYGGPAHHVRDSFGIRVSVKNQASFVDGLATAMQALIRTPELRRHMGEAALMAARNDQSMSAMADYFLDLYRRVAKGRRGTERTMTTG
jgi:glycosyltransferase involved in cell wall biosynthesis